METPDEEEPEEKKPPGEEEEGKDILKLGQVRDALRGALILAGLPRYDLLVFDGCLMGQLEVLHASKDLAEYIIASESTTKGIPKDQHLFNHLRDRELSNREVARRIVRGFGEAYTEHGLDNSTSAALEGARIGAVGTAFDGLARKLYPIVRREWAPISRAIFFSETYTGRTDYQDGEEAYSSFDLLDMARRIRSELGTRFPAEAEYQALAAAIRAAVVELWTGGKRRLSNGISIYAPVRWDNMRPGYHEEVELLDWAWPYCLDRLHAAQQVYGRRPGSVNARVRDGRGRATETIAPLDGAMCTFELLGTDLVWVLMDYAQRRPDGSYGILYETFHAASGSPHERPAAAVDRLIPRYPDGRSLQAQELGGVRFGFVSEGRFLPTTVGLTDPDVLETASVVGLLSGKGIGEDSFVEIDFDTRVWTVGSVATIGKGQDGQPDIRVLREIPADARLKVLLKTDSPTEGRAYTITGELVWGKGPRLTLNVAEPGEHALFITAESLAGTSIHRRVPYQIAHGARIQRILAWKGELNAAAVEGSWRIQERDPQGEGAWRDGAGTLSIARSTKPKGLTFDLEAGALKRSGAVVLEREGLPLLSMYADIEKRLARLQAWVVWEPEGGDGKVLELKALAAGDLAGRHLRLVRTGAAAPKGAPSASTVLEGTWRGGDGSSIEITRDRYLTRLKDGAEVDRGRIEIAGAVLKTRSDRGRGIDWRFKVEGTSLELAGPDGRTLRYERAPTPKQPAKEGAR